MREHSDRGNLLPAFVLVACGDDDSDFANRPSGGSLLSSSSVKSSSSLTLATPCKTETEDNCEYGELVDDRDGHTYKIVKIVDQVWMVENLNFETDSSFCYLNHENNCDEYGRLYRWHDAVGKPVECSKGGNLCSLLSDKVQGACPRGWHLPDTTEWNTLLATVGGGGIAGKALKSMYGWDVYYVHFQDAFDKAELGFVTKINAFSVRCLKD